MEAQPEATYHSSGSSGPDAPTIPSVARPPAEPSRGTACSACVAPPRDERTASLPPGVVGPRPAVAREARHRESIGPRRCGASGTYDLLNVEGLEDDSQAWGRLS